MSAHPVPDSIDAFARAIVAGNEDAIREFISDDYYGHARRPGEPTQADRWCALLPALHEAMPDLAIEVESRDREDGTVAVQARVSGTHTEALWGAPPTGRAHHWAFDLTLRAADDGWLVTGDGPPTTVIATLRDLGVIPPADEMHLPPRYPIAPPEFLLKLGFTGQAADRACAHLAGARVFEPRTGECAACVASGGIWPALRMCLVCGFVGCCDTSTNKHMHEHFEQTGHALFRSIRNDEGWIWCYPDAAFFERATLDRLMAAAAEG
jgi:Zn-finger in ubiquitin-hydrolases and other protein/SnoaL-like polyketide cyclase